MKGKTTQKVVKGGRGGRRGNRAGGDNSRGGGGTNGSENDRHQERADSDLRDDDVDSRVEVRKRDMRQQGGCGCMGRPVQGVLTDSGSCDTLTKFLSVLCRRAPR